MSTYARFAVRHTRRREACQKRMRPGRRIAARERCMHGMEGMHGQRKSLDLVNRRTYGRACRSNAKVQMRALLSGFRETVTCLPYRPYARGGGAQVELIGSDRMPGKIYRSSRWRMARF